MKKTRKKRVERTATWRLTLLRCGKHKDAGGLGRVGEWYVAFDRGDEVQGTLLHGMCEAGLSQILGVTIERVHGAERLRGEVTFGKIRMTDRKKADDE